MSRIKQVGVEEVHYGVGMLYEQSGGAVGVEARSLLIGRHGFAATVEPPQQFSLGDEQWGVRRGFLKCVVDGCECLGGAFSCGQRLNVLRFRHYFVFLRIQNHRMVAAVIIK